MRDKVTFLFLDDLFQDYPRLKAVLVAHRDSILDRPVVTSIAISYKTVNGQQTDQLAIVFGVKKKRPEEELEEEEMLPKHIQECPTDVVQQMVVDPFRFYQSNKNKNC